jgi:hypothetical protein
MVTNQVILVGQVDFLTFANTKHGNRFCRFNLRINNSDGSLHTVAVSSKGATSEQLYFPKPK